MRKDIKFGVERLVKSGLGVNRLYFPHLTTEDIKRHLVYKK